MYVFHLGLDAPVIELLSTVGVHDGSGNCSHRGCPHHDWVVLQPPKGSNRFFKVSTESSHDNLSTDDL